MILIEIQVNLNRAAKQKHIPFFFRPTCFSPEFPLK